MPEPRPIPPMALSVAEAAESLGVSVRSLSTLVTINALPSLRIGRRRLFRPAELEAWLAAGAPTVPGAADTVRANMRKGGSA